MRCGCFVLTRELVKTADMNGADSRQQ